MSILIMDMEMPKEGFVEILIRDDGTVQQTGQSYRIDGTDYYTPYIGEMPAMYEAVPVPPHGRLIDADELREKFFCGEDVKHDKIHTTLDCVLYFIDNAPTVIPASEVE